MKLLVIRTEILYNIVEKDSIGVCKLEDVLIKELVGMSGSILIAISMMFKTTTDKGVKWLRIFNLLGSIVFVIYGIILPAYSTIILNAVCVVLNIVGLVKICQKIKEGNNK